MIRYFSFTFSQLSGIEKAIQPQLDFHIGDEHAFGMQLNDGPWWTPSQISYKAHLIACNHMGPRPQGPMGPRLQKPMSLGRYRLNARRALHAQCAKAFVQAQRAKGVTGSTREGRYKFNARKAWQGRCGKGVTCSMREGRYKFNARRLPPHCAEGVASSKREGRYRLKTRRITSVGPRTAPVGSRTTPVGSRTAPVGSRIVPVGSRTTRVGSIQISACVLQISACGFVSIRFICDRFCQCC